MADTPTTADEFISAAIDAGRLKGVAALSPLERLVWLISEAEVWTDMEGIYAFLDHYSPDWITEAAAAFKAVGATEIAMELRAVPPDAKLVDEPDPRISRLGNLITDRTGYDYDAIHRVVTERLSHS